MFTYRNGYVPEGLLVTFNRGHNARDGHWTHAFPPAVYARHVALVARAKQRTGRTLALNYGWTAYRPLWAQAMLKAYYTSIGQPNMAAKPGTSSHGGFWEGQQTMAGDYSNWAWVYDGFGGRAAFAEDCRAVGALPNMIVPARGYPDEPWHVVFPDPWGAVPAFDGVVLPFNPEPIEPEGFLMALSDEQQAQVYDALVKHSAAGDYFTPDAIINILRGEITDILRNEVKVMIARVENGGIRYPGTNWNAFETLANVAREDDTTLKAILDRADTGAGSVDVAALAAQIRDGLGAEVVAQLARELSE